ncbi:MAG: hypothetical protein M0010_02160 [Actinomycetota bacterium]|nr:hypothetical protein [Actinomycetota bacterium]MDA8313971.1 hypothetical protein [Actinomycetota bacterium]
MSNDPVAPSRAEADCADCRAANRCLHLGEPCPVAEQHRPERCAVCGGLNPGDVNHARCM